MPSLITHHPKRKSKTTFLDILVDIAIVVAPISLLPQLYNVWTVDDSAGVSYTTWLLTLLITLPLIAYDIKHKVPKLAIMHTLIVLISAGIVIGLLVR